MSRSSSIAVVFWILIGMMLHPMGATAEESDPILTVDNGGHIGVITDLVVTSDGRYLVSSSIDKTIRVWDVEAKREVRKILGQVGLGRIGSVRSIALSSDDRWLAVGVIPANEGEFSIRLYDFRTGEMKKLLKHTIRSVSSLAFSNDDRWLIVGSNDQHVTVWDAKNGFRLDRTLIGHSPQGITEVGVLPDGRIVSAGWDHDIILWDGKRIAARYSAPIANTGIAISSQWIAVGEYRGNNIRIFDHDLNLVRTIRSKTMITGLAFSPNGRWLLAGFEFVDKTPDDVSVLYDARNDFAVTTTFERHTNLVAAVTFLDDDTAITGGGSNFEIYFWNTLGEILGEIRGAGQMSFTVGLDERGLDFSNNWSGWSNAKQALSLERHFDLRKLLLGSISKFQVPFQKSWGNWSLSHQTGGELALRDASLVIRQNGDEMAVVTRDVRSGYRHSSYGFTADGTIISSGARGVIESYDRTGKPQAKFVGHTLQVWSIAAQDHWLVSGSGDQTVKLWDLDELKSAEPEIDYEYLQSVVDYWNEDYCCGWTIDKVKKEKDEQGKSADYFKRLEIYPTLSLFADKDGEWVAWTESGYYAASAKGDKYVGFHVNRGADKAADFYPASRFHDSLYRPDILKLIWETGSEAKAIAKAGEKRKTEVIEVAKLLPPKIALNTPESRYVITAADTIELSFCVEPSGTEPITGIDLLLNGRPLNQAGFTIASKAQRICRERTINLLDGYSRQSITILARNRYASANPVVIEVEHKAPVDLFKPDLYVLAIGVSEYQDASYNLGYAGIDAKAIGEVFAGQGKLFNQIRHQVITDAEATKGNILDALDWIDQATTQRDLAVIFVAGHGVNDERGNYYFLPHDADPKRLRRTGVKWFEFQDVVTNLPGKVLLLADTCHSGNILGSAKRGTGADITAAIKSITAEGTGQVIMTAATGSSPSLESAKWGHGAFTKALIEGIDGQADYDHDGIVYIKELDLFVTNRVKTLTEGQQKPTTIIPASVPDFALGAVAN
jgi:WD40 repeat protein